MGDRVLGGTGERKRARKRMKTGTSCTGGGGGGEGRTHKPRIVGKKRETDGDKINKGLLATKTIIREVRSRTRANYSFSQAKVAPFKWGQENVTRRNTRARNTEMETYYSKKSAFKICGRACGGCRKNRHEQQSNSE